MHKEYLGDGVYVDFRGGMLVLTAENGITATSTIYLEDEVYAALLGYVERLKQDQSQEVDDPGWPVDRPTEHECLNGELGSANNEGTDR